MICYIDTSALVKKYIQEVGTTQVLTYWGESESVATSVVAFAEVIAAFQRRRRESATVLPTIQRAVRSSRRDWEGLLRVAVSDQPTARLKSW
jgi:predicted nucleic acid-binding protein